MKQLLWVGCLESDEEFKNKAKKGYDLASAQISQKSILLGIEKVTGMTFDSINGSVLPPYPVYEDRKIDAVVWEHAAGSRDISVGYLNDKYINRVNCKYAMLNEADVWSQERYMGGEVDIFVYSMRSAPMATAVKLKKKIPKSRIFLIITDLPQFMDLGQSKLKSILKKIDWLEIKRLLPKFDGYILYTKTMAEYLGIEPKKWMLMEGSYAASENKILSVPTKQKALMYSGKLDKEYGIELLVNAFMGIQDKDMELWLTGGGNAVEFIKEKAEQDSRIKFYGFLPTREDVIALQQKAALLLNMRLPSEQASNYCFPSKLFEYMVTGVPVLIFKIGGIPDEYYQYLYLVENEDKDSLIQAIQDTMKLDPKELEAKGQRAKNYVLSEKTSEAQANRIAAFVGVKRRI